MEGFSTAVKEHLKDKMCACFSSLWVFGLEESVRGCTEMETHMQGANTPTSRVTIPKVALLVLLWQVILSNRRAKDCREQGGQRQQEGEMETLSRGLS